MDYTEYSAQLDALPDVRASVEALFGKARASSQSRFFLALTDLNRFENRGRSFRGSNAEPFWILNQFRTYLEWVDQIPPPAEDESQRGLAHRLQMLAYSQFWECYAVQRLLHSLATIAAGRKYEPQVLFADRLSTYDAFKSIREECQRLDLNLSDVLQTLYRNQLRNAFSHSEYYIVADIISFVNCDPSRASHLPSLKFETWDRLYSNFMRFAKAFFYFRHLAVEDLTAKLPYRVSLPELGDDFHITRDGGYWSFRPVT